MQFVVKAWKEKLGKDSKVHFVSDSTGGSPNPV